MVYEAKRILWSTRWRAFISNPYWIFSLSKALQYLLGAQRWVMTPPPQEPSVEAACSNSGVSIMWLTVVQVQRCVGIERKSSGSNSKDSACNAGDPSSIPGLGRSPRGRNGNPLQYSRLENSHEQRSLAGYSPWGRRESGTTEWLHTWIQLGAGSCQDRFLEGGYAWPRPPSARKGKEMVPLKAESWRCETVGPGRRAAFQVCP